MDQQLAVQTATLTVGRQVGAGIVPAQVARDLGERLKFMIVNGKKLSQDEVFALAQFSAANGLNPFAGESYYLPGTGPVPGIVGYERKAKEELEREASSHGINEVVYFDIEYVLPEPSECSFIPGKDIAYKVILTDSLSSAAWRKGLNEMMGILREAGVTDYYQEALKMVGKRPSWTGTGVVRITENFGGEKMDRHERAKKRARKQAIKRRFPDLNLHEPENFNDSEPTITIEQPAKPRLTEDQYLKKLYGDTPAPTQPTTTVTEEEPYDIPFGETSEPENTETERPVSISDTRHANWKPSYPPEDMAFAMKGSDGVLYCEMSTPELSNRFNTLQSKIKKDPNDTASIDKRDVIKALMDAGQKTLF